MFLLSFNFAFVSADLRQRLARSCFGGVEKVNKRDPQSGQMLNITRAIPNNAYILVYERKTYNLGRLPAPVAGGAASASWDADVHPQAAGENPQNPEDVKEEGDPAEQATEPEEEEVKEPSEGEVAQPVVVASSQSLVKAAVPEDIMDSVWQANKAFINERHIYSGHYFDFLWRLARLFINIPEKEVVATGQEGAAAVLEKDSKKGESKKAVTKEESKKKDSKKEQLVVLEGDYLSCLLLSSELVMAFLVEVYARSKDVSLFPMWMHHATKVFSTYPQACRWLLCHASKEKQLIIQMLMLSPLERSRAAFSGLLEAVVTTMAPVERDHYHEQYDQLQKKDATVAADDVSSWVILFVEALLSIVSPALLALGYRPRKS